MLANLKREFSHDLTFELIFVRTLDHTFGRAFHHIFVELVVS